MDEMLEQQRRAAEQARVEEERAWRELSPSRNAGGDEVEVLQAGRKENGRKRASSGAGSNGKNGKGADIRSFFSPTKKKPS